MKRHSKKGFTITELIIVIVVIAILAAVLIPAFTGIIEKANASKALQAARNALTLILTDQNDAALTDGTVIQVGERYFLFDQKQLAVAESTPDTTAAVTTATVNQSGAIVYLLAADGAAGAYTPSAGITYTVLNPDATMIDPNDPGIPTYTYSQVNEYAQKFLDEVSYENVADTVSYIENYVPKANGNYVFKVYDKPAGCTIELQAGELTVFDNGSRNSYTVTVPAGPYTFYNITPGVGGEFWVKNGEDIIQKGHLRPTGSLRMIYTDTNGLQNIRDLGGWACDGGTIKYNKIIRGGQVIDATDTDRNTWVKLLGIDLDLFVKTYYNSQLAGKEQYRTQSPLGDNIELYQMDLSTDDGTDNMRSYAAAKEQMKGIMNRLFDNAIAGNTTYFHCLAGADRTGSVAILVEGVLGVSKADIDKDYELTSFNCMRKRDLVIGQYNILRNYEGATFRDQCINYLLDCGVTLEKINAFRKAVIDGNPEEIREPEPEFAPDAASINFCVPNGNGWIDGGRCSSKGEDRTDAASYIVTNYFAVQKNDIVYVKNLDIATTLYSGIYKTDKTPIIGFVLTEGGTNADGNVRDIDLTGEWEQFTVDNADAGYLRVTGKIANGKAKEDIVINIFRDGQWLTTGS